MSTGGTFAGAWNFGPNEDDARSVELDHDAALRPYPWCAMGASKRLMQPHEAELLKLDSSKAKKYLEWAPRWDLETALKNTIEWHQAWRNGEDMKAFSSKQIQTYTSA
jgi:CDP-glucose 4,6-dehydratase